MSSWVTLAILLFVIYIISQAIGKINLNGPIISANPEKRQGFDPSNYEVRQTMMNSSERIFFEILRRAVADKFDIYPQVNLDKIFKVKYLGNKYAFNGAKWAIDRRSVDYLLVNRETQSPKLAIELDGSSHERLDRIERDEKVASIFKQNGVPLIRFNVGDNFNENELREKLARYF